MPPPFHRLSVSEFARLLEQFPFRRTIDSVHMHHTWRPNHSQYRGHESIVAMWRYHTQERKFSDIAQHLTIGPDGSLWTGRDWNSAPASARGFNGNSISGPFMFEIVGDFDLGRDSLEGEQRHAVLDVVKLVLQRFALSAEALRFHNQMAAKSCPGSAIDRASFLAEVSAHQPGVTFAGDGSTARLFDAAALAGNACVARAIESLSRGGASSAGGDSSDDELDYVAGFSTGVPEGRGGSGTEASDDPALIDDLRPHLVNLRSGRLSRSGGWATSEGDVEAIFQEHLPRWIRARPESAGPARIVFYAHGGLVRESAGLAVARRQCDWWRKNDVYPVFFVWETGLFETIGQLLERILLRSGGDAGARGALTDNLTDPLVESAVRAFQAPRIWGGMKASAQQASAAGGGARFVAEQLGNLMKAHGDGVELHAVGHSAGSIFLAHFLSSCIDEIKVGFRTLHLLAPAITCDEFRANVVPRVGQTPGIGKVTHFTMRRAFEEADSCAGIYRKSLLYLVSAACEAESDTPILGLEDSLRDDPDLKRFFGLADTRGAHGEMVWSKSASHSGLNASQATTHGGFDDDRPTMESVLRRIRDLDDTAPIERFPEGEGGRGIGDWLGQVDLPAWLRRRKAKPDAGAPASFPAAGHPAAASLSPGRRRAVCIGIDEYVDRPLEACVNDATTWDATLRGFGFESRLLTNREATYERILAELDGLIDEAREGDTLVFQFAGHGTFVPDIDGDEADGDTPAQDEALVPFDYKSGAFVIDDEIAARVAKLRYGVRLTFLLDCCHSGTASRFAMSRANFGTTQGDVRSRWLPATQDLRDAHRSFRRRLRISGGSRSAGAAAAAAMREVTFAACQSNEEAFERDGQGDFTRFANEVLRGAPRVLSNAQFLAAVLRAFGSGARQRPHLDCDVSLRDLPFLGSALR